MTVGGGEDPPGFSDCFLTVRPNSLTLRSPMFGGGPFAQAEVSAEIRPAGCQLFDVNVPQGQSPLEAQILEQTATRLRVRVFDNGRNGQCLGQVQRRTLCGIMSAVSFSATFGLDDPRAFRRTVSVTLLVDPNVSSPSVTD